MLRELQEKRERLLAEARERLEQVTANTDESRAAELERQHDEAMAAFDANERMIERYQKLADAEARVKEAEARVREANRPGRDHVLASAVDVGEAPSYRDAFHAYLRVGGEVGEMPAEHRAVLQSGFRMFDQSEIRAQTTAPAAGGYTVPVELQNILVKSMKAWGPMYDEDVGTVLTTNGGGRITMPTVDDTAVTAVPSPGEGVTLTDNGSKDVTFGQKALDAFMFNTQWLRVSRELADDSIFAMETLLGGLLGERLGRIANLKLTIGTGVNEPNGVLTASSLGKTAGSATVITLDEIIELQHSVDPAYRESPKVAFMFNDSTLSFVRRIKDQDGKFIFTAGDVTRGIPNTISGIRYLINQAMPSIATGEKPILFGDFGKYFVRKVGGPVVGALQDKDFWPGFGVAGYIRFDGELADTEAVKHLVMA